jgi:hypothetical protein
MAPGLPYRFSWTPRPPAWGKFSGCHMRSGPPHQIFYKISKVRKGFYSLIKGAAMRDYARLMLIADRLPSSPS